jgi:hypothetical protein
MAVGNCSKSTKTIRQYWLGDRAKSGRLRATPDGYFLQVDARVQMFHALEALGFPAFLDAQLGYRSRGQNGDEIRADLTLGVRPKSDVLLMAQSFTAIAPWPISASSFAAQKFEVSGVYDLNPTLSLQLGLVYAPFGVNAPAERGIISALWARF